jgi:hypothetical protein
VHGGEAVVELVKLHLRVWQQLQPLLPLLIATLLRLRLLLLRLLQLLLLGRMLLLPLSFNQKSLLPTTLFSLQLLLVLPVVVFCNLTPRFGFIPNPFQLLLVLTITLCFHRCRLLRSSCGVVCLRCRCRSSRG